MYRNLLMVGELVGDEVGDAVGEVGDAVGLSSVSRRIAFAAIRDAAIFSDTSDSPDGCPSSDGSRNQLLK